MVPPGTIIHFLGNNAPDGYLKCDGTTYNISDYPALADHFEAEFGTKNYFGGDGTTFAVPDLRGEFLRCTGRNSHANQGSGPSVGSHQDSTEIPEIFVNSNNTPPDIGIMQTSTDHLGVENKDSDMQPPNGSGYGRQVATTSTWPSVANSIYTIRPTNTSVWYMIKY